MPFDAFKASGDSIKIETESFKNKGEIGKPATEQLKVVQAELNKITARMKGDLNKQELKLATLAVERELEDSVPDNFKMYYDRAETWNDAAELITGDVLSTVQDFIVSGLEDVISVVDEESWTDNLNKGEVEDVLKDLDPTITQGEIDEIYATWSGKENFFEKGKNAIISGVGTDRIKRHLEKNGVEF